MNLNTLISPQEAEAQFDEYRQQIADERTVEDEAILAGLRAATRGLPVISLTRAFEEAGTFETGLPKLAIINADATKCRASAPWHRSGMLCFDDMSSGDWTKSSWRALVGRHHVMVPFTTSIRRWGETVVPTIPPRHRPNRRRLHKFHILWEVEEWTLAPPRDPALLRHIRGDLWAVQAVWDLTDLERMVLSQRAQ